MLRCGPKHSRHDERKLAASRVEDRSLWLPSRGRGRSGAVRAQPRRKLDPACAWIARCVASHM